MAEVEGALDPERSAPSCRSLRCTQKGHGELTPVETALRLPASPWPEAHPLPAMASAPGFALRHDEALKGLPLFGGGLTPKG